MPTRFAKAKHFLATAAVTQRYGRSSIFWLNPSLVSARELGQLFDHLDLDAERFEAGLLDAGCFQQRELTS
jgi:hypothetical protein